MLIQKIYLCLATITLKPNLKMTPSHTQLVYIRALEMPPNGDKNKSYRPVTFATLNNKIVAKKIVENVAGTPSDALKDQLWEVSILEDHEHAEFRNPQGEFIFKHYGTNDYIASTGKDKESLYLTTVNNINTYDFENDPQNIIWNFQILPNWADDSIGAPRPSKLMVHKKQKMVMDLKGWSFNENTPIQNYEWKGNYWEKNKIGNQVWYLETPRTLVINNNGQNFTVTAHSHIEATQTLEVWDSMIGGTRLAALSAGQSYQTNLTQVYISAKMVEADGNINESTNGRTVYNLNTRSIQFYYGDPHEGELGDIETGL